VGSRAFTERNCYVPSRGQVRSEAGRQAVETQKSLDKQSTVAGARILLSFTLVDDIIQPSNHRLYKAYVLISKYVDPAPPAAGAELYDVVL
jgi:hypothetical protein